MTAPTIPGQPLTYEDDLVGEVEQPTMVRLWIDAPGAPPKIAAILPVPEPGGIVFFTILNLKILGETVPLYPGAYKLQADAVSGHGLRSGPSNLVTVVKPLCCVIPLVEIIEASWDPVKKTHGILFDAEIVDEVCKAEFMRVFLVSTTAEGVDPQEFFIPRSEWELLVGNYTIQVAAEPNEVPGTYTWKIRPGNNCGSLSSLSASVNSTIPSPP